jgi:hypothetical protein
MLANRKDRIIVLLVVLIAFLMSIMLFDQFIQDPKDADTAACEALSELSQNHDSFDKNGNQRSMEDDSAIWWYLATELPDYNDC